MEPYDIYMTIILLSADLAAAMRLLMSVKNELTENVVALSNEVKELRKEVKHLKGGSTTTEPASAINTNGGIRDYEVPANYLLHFVCQNIVTQLFLKLLITLSEL